MVDISWEKLGTKLGHCDKNLAYNLGQKFFNIEGDEFYCVWRLRMTIWNWKTWDKICVKLGGYKMIS